MLKRVPLALERLRAIAIRRRDDADVKALLWEIKRLHEVVVHCHSTISALERYDTDPGRGRRTLQVLKRLGTEPAVIASVGPPRGRDPSLPDHQPLGRGKPERGPVSAYARERLARLERDQQTEREAKRAARERR